MAYKFQKLLEKNSIVVDDLPAEIKTVIGEFHKLEYDLEDEEDPDDIKEIKLQLKDLDKELCELIAEEIDQELSADLTHEEIKENILRNFLNSGKTEVSHNDLVKYGYNTRNLGSTGEKLSNFSLQKGKFANNYKIIKH
ncbi:hypothetical protein MYP_664 [Sporocytophaga myxococcoides]|uniref:Uncharacterized protein n=1 Tax=Sporocytophaga myxococcoides TaxID=153721 RepID=A0A098LAH7_9BACT|nr:hypothetical protein [Sporocytophaga myxococcoides]GAL83437.1 hypothetical protein MYP_664 [Sporocytophaga myxococcoides]